jgi:RND family efflux transporter MFP subunit
MAIVLGAYFLVVWLIFKKLELLPWNGLWKTVVYGIAVSVGLIVLGALQYITPSSSIAVVQSDTQNISPLVSGRVESVQVEGTQVVKKGDVLFTLDARPFQYAVDQKTAALELAKIQLRDTTALVKKGAASRATVDKYTAERDQAHAFYESAVFDLENTTISAPDDGVVTLVTLYEGEVVAAMTPVISFLKTDKLRIASSIKQNGMENVRPGMRVSVVFPAAPGEIYEAEVDVVPEVSIQGQISAQDASNPMDGLLSSTGNYPVRITFPADAPEHVRRPGTEASLTIFTEEGHPINILSQILQFIGTWMNYVF